MNVDILHSFWGTFYLFWMSKILDIEDIAKNCDHYMVLLLFILFGVYFEIFVLFFKISIIGIWNVLKEANLQILFFKIEETHASVLYVSWKHPLTFHLI